MSATHPRVKDDHAAVIGLRTAPMGPDASWERPWGAPEQADEMLTARSLPHPLTPPAASRAEMTAGPATSTNAHATAVRTRIRGAHRRSGPPLSGPAKQGSGLGGQNHGADNEDS